MAERQGVDLPPRRAPPAGANWPHRRVEGLEFRVQGLGFKVQGSRFEVQGLRFKV